MSRIPSLRKITVTPAVDVVPVVNLTDHAVGDYLYSVHGLPVYHGEGSTLYIETVDAAETVFKDTFLGSKICEDLNLDICFTKGKTVALLDWASKYGYGNSSSFEISSIRDAIVSAIEYKIIESVDHCDDGELYAIGDFCLLLDRNKLFVKVTDGFRELR